MQHALMYQGSYEQNHDRLSAGSTTYVSTDGTERAIPAWPAEANGLRAGYLEKAGKKFVAVRLQFENQDVILENPVVLEPARHLGGKRFSPEPTIVDDDLASTLLDDAIRQNPEQTQELAKLINRINQVRRGGR